MIGRWGLYRDLVKEFRQAGASLDEAHIYAKAAERALVERRAEMIRIARASGIPVRKLAQMWGLSHTGLWKASRVSTDTP